MNKERIKNLEDDIFDLMKVVENSRLPSNIPKDDFIYDRDVDCRPYMKLVDTLMNDIFIYRKLCLSMKITDAKLNIIIAWINSEIDEVRTLMKKTKNLNIDVYRCLNKTYCTLLGNLDKFQKSY